jgi:hypothetical protein
LPTFYVAPQQPNLSFDQKVQVISAKIRGMYLDMCGDLEFALTDIIVVSLIKDQKERKAVKEVLFETVAMSKKIVMAQRALEKLNPALYNQFKPCFEKFTELTGWRNRFAHSRITGDLNEQDLSFLILHYIKDGEMVERRENVQELTNKLTKYASYIRTFVNIVPLLYTNQHISHLNRAMIVSANISIHPLSPDNQQKS